MIRSIAVLSVVPMAFFCAGLAQAADAGSVARRGDSACESQSPGGDRRDIRCLLEATGAARHLRFKASFSGSHDDTTASMAATLDGVPLVCLESSKTRTMGEDGDVSLECRFRVTEKAGTTTQVLGVKLVWSHAQYTGIELLSE